MAYICESHNTSHPHPAQRVSVNALRKSPDPTWVWVDLICYDGKTREFAVPLYVFIPEMQEVGKGIFLNNGV